MEILTILRQNPQIVVFLAIAIGYAVGKISYKGFSLGTTASVLIAALVLGQIDLEVPGLLQTIAFAFFLFAIGYKVGPQFFGSLKKEGLSYIILTFFFAIVGLVTTIVLAKFFGFDKGIAAGVLGGALTQSTVIGTAQDALKTIGLSPAQLTSFQDNVAVAYAITYIFGTAGLIIFYRLIPLFFRIDMKKEAADLEKEMNLSQNQDESQNPFFWTEKLDLRSFKLENTNFEGKLVADMEKSFPNKVIVEKIKHKETVLEGNKDTVLTTGDILSITGNHHMMMQALTVIGPEVDDTETMDVSSEILDVCVLNASIVGKNLESIDIKYRPNVFLLKITRSGEEIPITKKTVVRKCDIFKLAGAKKDIEEVANQLGYPERPTDITDLITVSLGIVVGTLVGLIAVHIGAIPVSLGIGGGVLLSGLIFGYLRNLHPTFGQINSGAQWILSDLGLNLFIACVGLSAGPMALHAIQNHGLNIFIAGALLTFIPHLLTFLFGKTFLKLNPVLLMGAIAGAGTTTAVLNTLKEECDSSTPVLGYTIPYAFGNVLLTIWGSVIVYVL